MDFYSLAGWWVEESRPQETRVMAEDNSVGVLAGVLIIAAGQLTGFLGARIWHRAVKGPAVIKEAKTTWKAALLTLGLAWTFAAFGEEMSYRGYLMTRAADVGDRSKLAYFAA